MKDFQEVKNNLRRESEIKSLQLANDYYDVRIFYYGDYAYDYEHDCIQVENISMVCKPKGANLNINYVKDTLYLELNEFPIICPWQIEEFKSRLDIAKESAENLQHVFESYFGITMRNR